MKNNVIHLNKGSLIRAKEVQDIFNIARSTVDNWARYGWLTRHPIGRNVFYDAEEVERLRLNGV